MRKNRSRIDVRVHISGAIVGGNDFLLIENERMGD